MSAVFLEDFVKSFIKTPLTEKQTHYTLRAVVAVFGAICVCLVFVVENMGSVLQLSISLGAIANGPLLGIFTMGVLFPHVHGTGALVGGSAGLGIMAWICFKAQAAIATGELAFRPKPVVTHGCSYTFMASSPLNLLAQNESQPVLVIDEPLEPDFSIYHISYMWYTLFGALITIAIAFATTFATGANDPRRIDPKLLSPFVRRILGTEVAKREEPLGTEDDIRYAECLDLKAISTSV